MAGAAGCPAGAVGKGGSRLEFVIFARKLKEFCKNFTKTLHCLQFVSEKYKQNSQLSDILPMTGEKEAQIYLPGGPKGPYT